MSIAQAAPPADPRVSVKAGQTYGDAVVEAGLAQEGPHAIVVIRDQDGKLRDLHVRATTDGEVEAVALSTPDGMYVMRHSCAHVLAQAVQHMYDDVRLGIGPPIHDGFYYDFGVNTPFTPEDLKAIESRMQAIVKSGQRFMRRALPSIAAAHSELATQPFKLELVQQHGTSANGQHDTSDEEVMEVGDDELTMYDNVDAQSGECVWTDLCRGPHLPTTKHIGAFKIMRSAAAYWRGNEKNPQLQRIYGTAWPTKDDLKQHLTLLEEAAKRDHRKLGVELDLFSFPDEIGSGLAVWHPKGGIVRRELEAYVRQRHIEEGFEFVNTPHITKEGLFHTSGHLPYYADTMFPPMEMDGSTYYLKAMNCPMHNLIYRSRARSYRELPLRLFEFGTVYRYEKSGVVHGLTRVRGLTQDDSHSYCTQENAPEEIKMLLNFVLGLLRDFGLDDFYLELSTRDDTSSKFVGTDAQWEIATRTLEEVAIASGLELVADPGGAAFYGPKISVQCKDAIGRTWQMSTIQLDFNQPQGFGLEYQAADGTRQQPVMIHSAKFGSIERFMGVLTEHYAGAFPFWLSPVQVVGIPVSDAHNDYLYEFSRVLSTKGLRCEVDESADRMQKKIRTAQRQKVPVMAIAGDTDVQNGTISFRFRDGSQHNGIAIPAAVDFLVTLQTSRSNASPDARMVAGER